MCYYTEPAENWDYENQPHEIEAREEEERLYVMYLTDTCTTCQKMNRPLDSPIASVLLYDYKVIERDHDHQQSTNDQDHEKCDGADTLTRIEKFEVFCRVCDNMLKEGRVSKANHKRWTEIW